MATRGHQHAMQRWQPTINWLNSRIPQVRFVLHPLDLDEMNRAVEQQTLDFVLTNPGQAVRLGRQYPLSWIATLSLADNDAASFGIGSALVVRDDSRFERIEQLSGQRIAAVSDMAFGGYLTLRYQLQELGIDPNRFFADVTFSGYPIDGSVYLLRDDKVDAAVVPVCLLENMVNEAYWKPGSTGFSTPCPTTAFIVRFQPISIPTGRLPKLSAAV